MKKSFFLLGAVLAIVAGCAKAEFETPVAPDAPQYGFVGTITQTKTTIEQSGDYHLVQWELGDVISVNNGSENHDFIAQYPGNATTFVYDGTDAEANAFFQAATTFTATYNSQEKEGGVIVVEAGSAKHLPMAAECEASERTLNFENDCAVLKVNVIEKATAISVTSGSETVSLKTKNDVATDIFYVPVTPGTNSLSVTVAGTTMSSNGAQQMDKSVVYPFIFGKILSINAAGAYTLDAYAGTYIVKVRNGIDGNVTINQNGTTPAANVFVDVCSYDVASLDINMPASHVEIERGSANSVISKTNSSTFVIKPTFTINTLSVKAGNVIAEGKPSATEQGKNEKNVSTIIIPSDATTDVQISIAPVTITPSATSEVVVKNEKSAESVVVVATENRDFKVAQGEVVVVEPTVSVGSQMYTSLPEAFAAAKSGDEVKLLADAALEAQLEVAGKSIALNLNGKNITYAGSASINSGIILVHNGAGLTINGEGAINPGDKTYAAIALTKSGDNAASPANITINGGTITGKYYAITGNGSRQNTNIVVNGGKLTSPEGCAIFNPQQGTIAINGGVLEGNEAIYMKSGAAVVANGGILRAFGPKGEYVYHPSGSDGTGDAIVVDNCDYPGGAPSLTINGAVLESANGYQIGAYYGNGKTEISDIYSTDNTLTACGIYVWKATDVEGIYKLGLPGGIVNVTPETAQDALDEATEGTTIVLGAGDYGKLYLRNNGADANRIFKDITIAVAKGTVNVEQIAYQKVNNKYLDIENLIIKGINFNVPAKSAFLCDVDPGHSIRINGLTIQNCSKVGDKSEGTITYDNAAFVGLYYDGATAIGATYAGDNTLTCGYHNIVVKNNSISKVFQPVKVPNEGPLYGLTIEGNTFDDCFDNHMMLSSKTTGDIVVKDNIIKNMTGRFARIAGAQADAKFVISGNKVVSPKKYDTGGDEDIFKITGTAGFSVSESNNEWKAGEFSDNNTKWIAKGIYEAKIGDAKYPTLAAAIAAAKTGETVELLCDVDLAGQSWTPAAFSATFDGKNYKISNLTVSGDTVGLFKSLNGATIKDLVIDNAKVTSTGNYSGALAGIVATGSISNVKVTNSEVSASGEYVGGLFGIGYSDVSGCQVSNTKISGKEQVGGAIGYMWLGDICDCTVSDATVTAESRAGGLIGKLQIAKDNIGPDPASKMCVNNNTVSGSVTATDGCAAGLIGQLMGDDIRYEIKNNNIDAVSVSAATKGNLYTLRDGQPNNFVSSLNDASKISGNLNIASIGQTSYDNLASALIAAPYAPTTITIRNGVWCKDAVGQLDPAGVYTNANLVRYKLLTITAATGAKPKFVSDISLGYDDSSTANAMMTVQKLNFENASLKISNYRQVTVGECNFSGTSSSVSGALVVLDACCKNHKTKGNYMTPNVFIMYCSINGTASASIPGIRLRNSGNVLICGTTVKNAKHNGILFESNASTIDNTPDKDINIKECTIDNWNATNAAEGGRAIRLSLGTLNQNSKVTIKDCILTKSTLGLDKPDFIKITGSANAAVSLNDNKWNTLTLGDLTGDKKGDYYFAEGTVTLTSVK